jgi:hypothetical protein
VAAPRTDAKSRVAMSPEQLAHCGLVAQAFVDGEIVPFLGAGANMCGRPRGEWKQGSKYLPAGAELSKYLAERSAYPLDDVDNLIRVAQYQQLTAGEGPLYNRLREVFVSDALESTDLHRFLAGLPRRLAELGSPRNQLVVTTNYDDLLERAYRKEKQPFDLFTYVATGKEIGKFVHTPFGESPAIVSNPRKFTRAILDERPVIVKIHGTVAQSADDDSFVITEDHYIDFLQRTDIAKLIPLSLLPVLQKSHFLFMGYSLRDWNVRVLLQQIWAQQERKWGSWAVQHETNVLDQTFWMHRGVAIQIVDLVAYVRGLETALDTIAKRL